MENEDLTFIESDTTQFLDDFQTQEEQDTSIKTDAELDEVFLTTGNPHTDVEVAKKDFVDQNRPLQSYAMERLEYLDVDPEQFQKNVDKYYEKELDFLDSAQFFYEQALGLKDTGVEPVDLRIASNNRIAQSVIEKYQDREETGALDAILDFGSMALHEFVTSPKTLLTKDELEALGTEILANKIKMTPKEFGQWFDGFAEDYMSKGPREDSSWRLSQLNEIVNNNGFRAASDKGITKAFALLDATGVGTTVVQVGKAGTKLAIKTAKKKTLTGRVSSNEGLDAGADAAEEVLNRRVDPEVTSDVGPASLNPHLDEALPSEGSVSRRLQENRVVQEIKKIYESNVVGRVLPKADIERLASEAGVRMKQAFNNPVYKAAQVSDEIGNYKVTMQFGKATDGQPYKPTAAGTPTAGAKAAAQRMQGELVPVMDGDDLKGFVVQKSENLNLAKEIPGIEDVFDGAMKLERNALRNAIDSFTYPIGRVFGSAATRGLERTTELANLGEGAAAALGKVVKDASKPIQALNNTDRAALAFITRGLRDNPLESAKRGWYDDITFSNKYEEFTGKKATPKVIDAYNALVEISDASYLLQASNIMQRYVQKGYRAVTLPNGFRVPAKRLGTTAKVPEQARIMDIFDNQITYKEFLESGTEVWRLDKPYEGVEYVIRPSTIDSLDPTDVLGYNAGGPRTNPSANWFVVAGDYEKGRIKTFLSAFTEEEALKAVTEINTIRAARGSEDIDEIIKANNSWNPDVETLEDFELFARENKWDLDTQFDIKVKERNVSINAVDGEDDVFNGMSTADFIENDMRRNDRVLPHYGGGKTTNYDPASNVVAGINSAINDFSYRAYTMNAMVAWVKKAKGISGIELPKNIPSDDYFNLFMNAKFTGSGKEVTRMKEVWNIDRRRMNVKREDEIFMRNLGDSAAKFVYNITGKELDFGDPTNLGLKVGFMTKFGFLNIKQTVVQSFHVSSIMAISPKQGSRGAALALLMRGLHTFPDFAEAGVKRLAGRYDLSEDELKEIMEYVRTSGRADLDTEIAELNTGYGRGISGFAGEDYTPSALANAWANTKKTASKGMDIGLVPFREGDRLARMTGTYTAILEFKAKNPGVSILSEQARMQIARRDSALNFHMSSVSNASWQKGAMRLPTQWLSHTMRSMETLFNGKEFTKMERARLGAVLVPMYGTAGFGFASAADYIAEKTGMSTDNELFTYLKWGLIDGIADTMMADEKGRVGVGFSTSFAPAGQIRETLRKINEGQFLEVVGGPSAQIGGDIVQSLISATQNLTDGNGTLVTEDVMKTFRNISTLDNVAKMVGILNNGQYRSKTGATVPGEMTTTEAISTGLGFGPLKVQEFYATKSVIYNDDKKIRTERKSINRTADKAHTMIQTGDPAKIEEGFNLLYALKMRIDLSGASEATKMSMRKALVTPLESELPRLILKLRKNGRAAMAERLASTLGN